MLHMWFLFGQDAPRTGPNLEQPIIFGPGPTLPLHTKKINNTNKLMQISYHSTLTKIQKLQNFKKIKKKIYVPIGMLGTGQYCLKLVSMVGI